MWDGAGQTGAEGWGGKYEGKMVGRTLEIDWYTFSPLLAILTRMGIRVHALITFSMCIYPHLPEEMP